MTGESDRIPQAVPPVLSALAAGLAQVLGERLEGVYLGGSAAMGDFVPATSDLDVLVVIRGTLAPDDLRGIEELHGRLLQAHPSAAQLLEGDYAPRHLLVPQGTSRPVPGIQHGHFLSGVPEIMLSADNIANMRQHGIAICGPPAAELLPSVTADQVRTAVLVMLQEGPGYCASEQDAAAELLNLVRSLCALETGQPTTKSQGAAWARMHLDQEWQPLIQRAQAVRSSEPVADNDSRLRTGLPRLDRALRPLYLKAASHQ